MCLIFVVNMQELPAGWKKKKKKIKYKKNIKNIKKAPFRNRAVLKKQLARKINKIEILRSI